MRTWSWLTGMAVLGLVAALAADEEKIPLKKLPREVVAAVKKKFPDAKLLQAGKEKEGKEYVFEVAIDNKGQKIDVTLKADGTIMEIEKTIPFKELPEAVVKSLKAKYPKGSFKKAEEVTKGDKLKKQYFEVVVATRKKTIEVVLSPQGKILKVEDKEKDEDEKKEKDGKEK